MGAFALWGDVLASYLAHDGVNGRLGFPTSRVGKNDHGSVSATFERGSITCVSGSCHVAA